MEFWKMKKPPVFPEGLLFKYGGKLITYEIE